MTLGISSLHRALAKLDEAIAAHAGAPKNKLIRDACILRFGYSYELTQRALRGYLDASEPTIVTELSFPSVIRLGYERGLLAQSWNVWKKFRDAVEKRHEAYEDRVADDIMLILPFFAAEANFLLEQFELRQAVFHEKFDEIPKGIL